MKFHTTKFKILASRVQEKKFIKIKYLPKNTKIHDEGHPWKKQRLVLGPEVVLNIFVFQPKWAMLVPTRCQLSKKNLVFIGAGIADISVGGTQIKK